MEISASTVSKLVKALRSKDGSRPGRALGTYRYLIVDARFDKVRRWARETGRTLRELFR